MTMKNRWSKNTLIFGGTIIWGLLLISCIGVNRAVLAPPKIPGAHYVGTKECAQCHTDQTDHFATASHARLNLTEAAAMIAEPQAALVAADQGRTTYARTLMRRFGLSGVPSLIREREDGLALADASALYRNPLSLLQTDAVA